MTDAVTETENPAAENIAPRRGRPPGSGKAKTEAKFDAADVADGDEFSIYDAMTKVTRDQVDEITYIPGEGDPARTAWNGVSFPAHVPVKVKGSQTIKTPLPIRTKVNGEWIDGIQQPDGTLQTRHVERDVPMVVLAARNPRFSVNGAMPIQQKKGSVRLPDDPDKYRGYAMAWIVQAAGTEELDARWNAEDALRKRCGCNDADIQWLTPFLEARRMQLSDAA